jgi:hypothetical protein
VPGGKYLHLGVNIFSRHGLKPISTVNYRGELNLLTFSQDGERYALTTSEREDRNQREALHRFRLHDTASGRTLLSVVVKSPLRHVAFSPDGKQVATVDDNQEVALWPVP